MTGNQAKRNLAVLQPKQISDKTSSTLVTAVDRMCDQVEKGASPTRAAVKVAKDMGMQREHVRLMCHGYNTGAINTHRREGETFAEKFAALPLADADEAIEEVFPDKPLPIVKTASVAPVYARPMSAPTQKVASVADTSPPADPKRTSSHYMSREYGLRDKRTPYELAKEKLAAFQAVRDEADNAERKSFLKLAAVEDAYVSVYGKKPTAVGFLRKWAGDLYGRPGEIIVDRLANRFIQNSFEREKYAAVAAGTDRETFFGKHEPRHPKHPVMLAIKEAMDAFTDWLHREIELPKLALETFRDIGKIYPPAVVDKGYKQAKLLPPGETHEAREEAQWQKRADLLSLAAGAAAAKMTGKEGPKLPTDYSKARLMVNNPRHQATLRRLHAEAMLNRLIQTDDVVGSYNPQEIADAWYELNEASPGVVNNVSLLRANLRRQLQGNLTPFEAKDLVMSGIGAQTNPIPVISGLDSPSGPR